MQILLRRVLSLPSLILSTNGSYKLRFLKTLIQMRPVFLLIITAFVFSCGLTGCDSTGSNLTVREQILMGTSVAISISGTDSEKANRAADLAFREIRRIEQIMSTFIPESEISLINGSSGGEGVLVHPELLFVIREALRYGRLSDGAFDITYKPLSRLWHFEEGSQPPDPEAVLKFLPLVNYQNVLIGAPGRVSLKNPGMAIGLGGIAKGYAVDRALEVLQQQGIENAIVNAGGDLRAIGRRSVDRMWRIGIQDARDPDAVMAEIPITNAAAATSGDYEKFFIYQDIRFHHLLDPKTGFPARGCRGVTIICPTTMMADAMATAVFVLGPDRGMALIQSSSDLEGMIVDRDGQILTSAGFNQEGIR